MLALQVIVGPLGKEYPVKTFERMEAQADEQRSEGVSIVSGRSDVRDTHSDNAGDWLTFEATAYIAMCQSGCTGVTATGIDVRQSHTYEGMRIIATDPAVVPLWSIVELRYADGSTERAIAADTGGAIDGNRIDLLVADEATAWTFGRQDVGLKIIEEGR
jgi:3D (Asp-Asp-Asp) domain-containing protein